MRFQARVEVQLRPGIADPEGATIERALPALGFDGVVHVRAGRSFSFEVDAPDEGAARTKATELADRLLANPVIEESRLELVALGRLSGAADRGRRLPGDQLRARRRPGRRAVWAARASCSGTVTRASAPSTRSCCPGGFAHGDYLRPGALARFSPIMDAVTRFAREGGPVVGICNGFQVLTEAGLLPGCAAEERPAALLVPADPAAGHLDRVRAHRVWPHVGQELVIPINHFSGSYTCDEETLRRLQRRRPRSCCATWTTRTARWTTSPASPTRPATWSG